MADDDVQLTDLEVIQRYSLAVRGASASRADVIAALQADLAWLQGGRRALARGAAAPAKAAPAKAAPQPATADKPAEKPADKAVKAPAKKAPAKAAPSKRKA
jgi:hypothetical protein